MHPHLKEARDGHAAKLKRIAGFHGTSNLPSGDNPPPVNQANGPQPPAGQLKADGKLPRKNLGKFARGGKAKHKGTNVNIMIGHPGGPPAQMPMAAAPALPMPRPAPMPPPGMAPPGAMPPGMPPGLPPGAIPPHKRGGHVFAKGGKVAPQYPQTVKTAIKQPSLKADMKAKGGKAKGKWAGGPMPVAAQVPQGMPVSPPAGMPGGGQGMGQMMPQGMMGRPMGMPQGMPQGMPMRPQGMPMMMPQGGVPMRKHGGHADAKQDMAMIKRTVKTSALKRKSGGRTYEAGAASGEGRLEKIEHYGKKAHMKPHRGD